MGVFFPSERYDNEVPITLGVVLPRFSLLRSGNLKTTNLLSFHDAISDNSEINSFLAKLFYVY